VELWIRNCTAFLPSSLCYNEMKPACGRISREVMQMVLITRSTCERALPGGLCMGCRNSRRNCIYGKEELESGIARGTPRKRGVP